MNMKPTFITRTLLVDPKETKRLEEFEADIESKTAILKASITARDKDLKTIDAIVRDRHKISADRFKYIQELVNEYGVSNKVGKDHVLIDFSSSYWTLIVLSFMKKDTDVGESLETETYQTDDD